MDMSPWQCGECECQNIAYELAACPQCGAPKQKPETPAPAAAARKKGAAA